MGWHAVEISGAEWWERGNQLVGTCSKVCFAAAPDKVVILSKESPGFNGARLYFSPEASSILQGFLQANGATPCPAPKPEDVDTIEFEIGDEWQLQPVNSFPSSSTRRGGAVITTLKEIRAAIGANPDSRLITIERRYFLKVLKAIDGQEVHSRLANQLMAGGAAFDDGSGAGSLAIDPLALDMLGE